MSKCDATPGSRKDGQAGYVHVKISIVLFKHGGILQQVDMHQSSTVSGRIWSTHNIALDSQPLVMVLAASPESRQILVGLIIHP